MADKSNVSSPLQGFEKLNSITHLYQPPDSAASPTSDPEFLILCSWAFAHVRHISKYLRGYQERYPQTQILLVQVDTLNILYRPDAWQLAFFRPAILAIQNYLSSTSTPRVLMHTFSNGGSHTAVQLTEAYRHFTPSTTFEKFDSHDLPINAIIFDSAPSPPRFHLGIKAMMMSLPKGPFAQYFGAAAIYTVMGSLVVLHNFGISELFLAKTYRELNRGPFVKQNMARTYIYSKSDAVMREDDILAHAEGARAALSVEGEKIAMVSTEEFVGSGHVNHVSVDPERYWAIVRKTWDTARNSTE